LDTDPRPDATTGVTDEIIQEEIQAHWTARLMSPVRRLYLWILHWAETRYAGTALAAVAFSEAVWFPIPADPLLVALCLGKPKRSFWYALNCTFWSTFGAMLAMLVGTMVGEERVLAAMAWIDQHLAWLPAWLHLDLEQYARMALDLFRQFVIGGLIYKYGERARRFIDKYFNLTCTVIMAVLILILVGVKYRAVWWDPLSRLFGG
jgi:membrane protein YqaA with SNARE-associated domain